MKVLVVGGGGFIGRHIVQVLCRRGHDVTITRRTAKAVGSAPCPACEIIIDYREADTPPFWVDKLQGMDCVINAAGILRETPANRFEYTHHHGPCALFKACRLTGVGRVIQISALGTDHRAGSPYHKTKRAADDCLRELSLDWIVLQPSVVYGPDSGSGRMFNRIAALPFAAVPGQGDQMMQPVYIEDITEAVANLVENPAIRHETIAAVGPTALSYASLLKTLRASMGRKPARLIGIPMPLMRLMSKLTALNPGSPLTPETLAMLERGSVADVKRFAEILGHSPRRPEDFQSR
ncbi:MAG: complex I NDUFA9 subunit family protein [Pseudomonadota bacterium]|nr:complex I NDUFA9 subunit family protein [Pseudomonadota bacterium]